MRFLLTAGLAAAAVVACAADSFASCNSGGNFRITSEGPWSMFMNVDKGQPCSSGFMSGGSTQFKRLEVVSPPQRGRLNLRQGGRFSYRPNGGYSGPDSFTLRVCGELHGARGCANLRYAVTVS